MRKCIGRYVEVEFFMKQLNTVQLPPLNTCCDIYVTKLLRVMQFLFASYINHSI